MIANYWFLPPDDRWPDSIETLNLGKIFEWIVVPFFLNDDDFRAKYSCRDPWDVIINPRDYRVNLCCRWWWWRWKLIKRVLHETFCANPLRLVCLGAISKMAIDEQKRRAEIKISRAIKQLDLLIAPKEKSSSIESNPFIRFEIRTYPITWWNYRRRNSRAGIRTDCAGSWGWTDAAGSAEESRKHWKFHCYCWGHYAARVSCRRRHHRQTRPPAICWRSATTTPTGHRRTDTGVVGPWACTCPTTWDHLVPGKETRKKFNVFLNLLFF